jgi:hypothetical protein
MSAPFASGALAIVAILDAAVVALLCLTVGRAMVDPVAAGVFASVAGLLAAVVALLCLALGWAGRDDEPAGDRTVESSSAPSTRHDAPARPIGQAAGDHLESAAAISDDVER